MRSRLVAIGLFSVSTAFGQWLHYPTAGLPRTADGKPNLTAPAPKLADGTPDLSGIWLVPGLKYLINIAADLKHRRSSLPALGQSRIRQTPRQSGQGRPQ